MANSLEFQPPLKCIRQKTSEKSSANHLRRDRGHTRAWSPAPVWRPTTNALTSREYEVLSWLAMGKSGPEIAIILGISVCTVRLHIQAVKRKLDASNIPHAVSRGFDRGILHQAADSAAASDRDPPDDRES